MKNHTSDKFEISFSSNTLSFLFLENKSSTNNRNGPYFIIGLQGEAFIEIDNRVHALKKGTLISITPGHLFIMLSCSDDFLFEYLFFEYDFMSDFPLLLKAHISDRMGVLPCLSLDADTFALLGRYYDLISDRYHDNNCQIEIVKGLLFSFILEVSRIYSGQSVDVKVSRKNELTDSFFRLLHQYYKEERTTDFYAGRLCVTDKHLSRVIKEVTGQTIYFWISNFIIKEAKLLLKSTEKSVTEIAEELMFPNSSFFARFFRKQTGFSPMQFKKS